MITGATTLDETPGIGIERIGTMFDKGVVDAAAHLLNLPSPVAVSFEQKRAWVINIRIGFDCKVFIEWYQFLPRHVVVLVFHDVLLCYCHAR
jgi:hypothetical protein